MRRFLCIALEVCLLAVPVAAQSPPRAPAATPSGIREQIANLASADPVTRAVGACHLALLRRDAAPAVEALVQLLADATPIAPVLCRRDTPSATVVNGTWETTPGFEAARALGAAGRAGAEALVAAARHVNPDVRRHAVRGLAAVRDSRVEGLLLAAIRDADARIRAEAARGLGRFRGGTVTDALLTALVDASAAVREAAARSLGRTLRRR